VALVLGGSSFDLQGDKEFVEAQMKKLLPLVTGDAGTAAPPKSAAPTSEPSAVKTAHATKSIQAYFKEKAPQNAYEAIAVGMFHRREHDQKDELSGDEIRMAMIQGRYPPPNNFPQALTDCRRRYGYVEVGTKKGFWRLTNAGATVVDFDLPKSGKA